MKYNIGQILTSTEDIEVEKGFSGDKEVIPKGNKVIIGADKLAHHIRNGCIQRLSDDIEVVGYSADGIAEYLYIWMRNHFPIDEMLESYDDTKENLIDSIAEALYELGFYEE